MTLFANDPGKKINLWYVVYINFKQQQYKINFQSKYPRKIIKNRFKVNANTIESFNCKIESSKINTKNRNLCEIVSIMSLQP